MVSDNMYYVLRFDLEFPITFLPVLQFLRKRCKNTLSSLRTTVKQSAHHLRSLYRLPRYARNTSVFFSFNIADKPTPSSEEASCPSLETTPQNVGIQARFIFQASYRDTTLLTTFAKAILSASVVGLKVRHIH